MKNKSASQSVLICLSIVLAFAVYSSTAQAVTTTWTADGGDWFDPANWDNGVPSCSTDAFISNGGKAEINGPGAIARSLTLGGSAPDSGTVTIDRGGSLMVPLSCGNGTISVGRGGTGTLSLTNGGTVASAYGYVAELGGEIIDSNGAITVDGAGSTWTLGGATHTRLFIGGNGMNHGGTALVNVTNGGSIIVDNPGGSPSVAVGLSGTLTGNGTITANGTNFLSRATVVNGTLAPSGTFHINGDLRLNPGAATLCNVTPQVQDRVDVLGTGPSGTATLGGRLLVILSGTFSPSANCTARFTLLHADTARNLMFNSFSFLGIPLNAPYTPEINYDNNNVYLDLVFNNCE